MTSKHGGYGEALDLDFGDSATSEESEEDLVGLRGSTAFDAVVVSTDWTTETLLAQLSRGSVEMDPSFQRRDAWDRRKKSRFVESLVVGLPVPEVVLAERKGRRGEYIVLDGKQRLLTLAQFSESLFPLAGLELRSDLNKYRFSDLPESERQAFLTQTIRTVVVRNWPTEDFLYLVFLRLNTGSVPLSPQELRQALHPGPFVAFVNRYTTEDPAFHLLFRRPGPDFRMRDVELLVRYFAFTQFLTTYGGNLKALLDATCESLNSRWETDEIGIVRSASECSSAVSATIEIFGDHAFRRWNYDRYERPFNRAVFDVMTYYASSDMVRGLMLEKRDAVEKVFRELCRDYAFSQAIISTTKSLEAVYTRLRMWGESLSATIGIALPLPTLGEDGRIAYA